MTSVAPRQFVAVDVSCSGLVVATDSTSAVLSPAVAPASVLATVLGGALPASGDRMQCSAHVDAVAAADPGSCVLDPLARIDSMRVTVAGMSATLTEVLGAPLSRALHHADASTGDRVMVLLPGHWGGHRTRRLVAAFGRRAPEVTALRAPLVVADALPSSTATWTTVVETMSDRAALTLVHRSRDGLRVVDGGLVHRTDPVRDAVGDDYPQRIVAAAVTMRSSHRETRNGAHEILSCGRDAGRVVAECDARLEPSFVVPPTAPAEAALHLFREHAVTRSTGG